MTELIFVVVFYDAIKKVENDKDKSVEYPAELGFTVELCTRTVDQNLPLNEIVQREVERVSDYKISLERIEQVMTYR